MEPQAGHIASRKDTDVTGGTHAPLLLVPHRHFPSAECRGIKDSGALRALGSPHSPSAAAGERAGGHRGPVGLGRHQAPGTPSTIQEPLCYLNSPHPAPCPIPSPLKAISQGHLRVICAGAVGSDAGAGRAGHGHAEMLDPRGEASQTPRGHRFCPCVHVAPAQSWWTLGPLQTRRSHRSMKDVGVEGESQDRKDARSFFFTKFFINLQQVLTVGFLRFPASPLVHGVRCYTDLPLEINTSETRAGLSSGPGGSLRFRPQGPSTPAGCAAFQHQPEQPSDLSGLSLFVWETQLYILPKHRTRVRE